MSLYLDPLALENIEGEFSSSRNDSFFIPVFLSLDEQFTSNKIKRENEKVALIKEGLNEEQKVQIVKDAVALKKRQEEPQGTFSSLFHSTFSSDIPKRVFL